MDFRNIITPVGYAMVSERLFGLGLGCAPTVVSRYWRRQKNLIYSNYRLLIKQMA
jgi:hypothetical protein